MALLTDSLPAGLRVTQPELEASQTSQKTHFRHSPLPDASTYIRLLSIEDKLQSTRVKYSLSTWLFEEAPTYHAISYTWGTFDHDEFVCLDGATKRVRKNCADALRQICHFKTARYYWIDTLCINQDDAEEKSRQVAMMGRIYQRAGHVLACIGTSEDEDTHAIAMLCDYGKREASQFKPLDVYEEFLLEADRRRFFIAWARSHTAGDFFRTWVLCNHLAERDYFARIWTAPEFVLAHDVLICLGNFSLRWRALFDMLQFVNWDMQPSGHRELFVDENTRLSDSSTARIRLIDFATLSKVEVEQAPLLQHFSHAPGQTKELLSLKRFGRKLNMQGIVMTGRFRSCSDPRDAIYGMLPVHDERKGLLSEPQSFRPDDLRPDYSLRAFDVAVAVLERFVLFLENVVILIQALKLHRRTPEVELGFRQTMTTRTAAFARGRAFGREMGHAAGVLGKQLDDGSEWQLGDLLDDGDFRPHLSTSTGGVVGVVCANTNNGDWILDPVRLQGRELIRPHQLVVRRSGDVFTIVGLAHISERESWPWGVFDIPEGFAKFSVFFDPFDYCVFVASMMYEAPSEKLPVAAQLALGGCSVPRFSYATLEPELSGALEPGNMRSKLTTWT